MTYQRAIDRRRYLQSRHFYTRLDLDGVEESESTVATEGSRRALDELVGNTTIQGLLDTLSRGSAQYSEPLLF